MGLAINEKDCSMKDNDGSEVAPFVRRAHPQDGDENKQVGLEDDHNDDDLVATMHSTN